jgi:signal transduction histidine kinase
MMASLAAFVDSRSAAGIPVKFIPPEDRDVRYYLSRMGMGKVLDASGVSHELPSVNANLALSQRALVEVEAFSSEDDVAALVSIVNYQSVAAELQRAVSRALLEAGCNVPEHARVHRGFMAAQVINNQLRLSVADAGVGILSTLQDSGATNEKQALLLAVTGTSEFDGEDRGRGLKSIHESIGAHGGRGALISGQSIVSMSPNRLFAWTGNSGSYAGTILDVVLPIS